MCVRILRHNNFDLQTLKWIRIECKKKNCLKQTKKKFTKDGCHALIALVYASDFISHQNLSLVPQFVFNQIHKQAKIFHFVLIYLSLLNDFLLFARFFVYSALNTMWILCKRLKWIKLELIIFIISGSLLMPGNDKIWILNSMTMNRTNEIESQSVNILFYEQSVVRWRYFHINIYYVDSKYITSSRLLPASYKNIFFVKNGDQ